MDARVRSIGMKAVSLSPRFRVKSGERARVMAMPLLSAWMTMPDTIDPVRRTA
jgi:hypothetical protein